MAKLAYDIILKPVITEKSMEMLTQGKYTFKVAKDSNKIEIAKAVEALDRRGDFDGQGCREEERRYGCEEPAAGSYRRPESTRRRPGESRPAPAGTRSDEDGKQHRRRPGRYHCRTEGEQRRLSAGGRHTFNDRIGLCWQK